MSFLPTHALADFNFGAAGDWGCTSNTDATLSNVKGKSPERVFALGDYSYSSTGTCFFNKIDPTGLTSITKIAIGNHEDDDSEGFSSYMSHFGLSQTYYSFNYDVVHVLVMDTDRNSYGSGSAQRNFVQSDLQSASTNPNIKWIIVYFHKPMYTSPNTCSSSSCSNTGSENRAIRDGFHAMFDQYGVDLVLEGHIHDYQRSYKIKYDSGSPDSPTITDNNANTYTEGNGEIFAIVGTGGVNFHALSGKAAFTASQQDKSFGQLDVKVTNSGNTLEGKFYRNGDNSVLDSFSINKAAPPPPSYHYDPSFTATGSNYADAPSSPSLQLSQFSVAAWFKTSADYSTDAMIVNKGGLGSETAGQNMNYGIWMTSNEQIRAGFESGSTAADFFATSPNKYNDNKWHYAVVTYGGSTVILYIDGVQVGTFSASGVTPDTSGTQPVRVGANSRVTPPTSNFFIGNIDEVRVWNDDLTPTEVSNAFTGSSFNTAEQVLYLSFTSGGSGTYHYDPSFTATGSNYIDTANSGSLQLSQFSVAAWFKTSSDYSTDAMIVNKGGLGSETAGQNMNYGIWMTSTEQIRAGFETTGTAADRFATSPNKYNDGQWHYAVVTFGGTSVLLYIDGTQVGSFPATGESPESSGVNPVRVGANSRITPPGNFFIGNIDEVRVWNDDLTPTEVSNAFTGSSFNTAEQVLYLDFTNAPSGLSGGYNYGPSLTLSGPS
jgi:concanavalin A-like lectin/glucanase superfamily protein/calcineurin-like phosphoesterase family protein